MNKQRPACNIFVFVYIEWTVAEQKSFSNSQILTKTLDLFTIVTLETDMNK